MNNVYKIDKIKSVNNPNSKMEFPVAHPNMEYLRDINDVINSYGLVFQSLANNNYVLDDYLKELKENQMLCAIINEDVEFSVTSTLEGEPIFKDKEIIIGENVNIPVLGIAYSDIEYTIKDKEGERNVTLYLDYDFLKFFFSGSYVFIEDVLNKKKYFVYLD